MREDESEFSSLVRDDGSSTRKRLNFWQNLFKRKRKDDPDDPKEDTSLLKSPDLNFAHFEEEEEEDKVPSLTQSNHTPTGRIYDFDEDSAEVGDERLHSNCHLQAFHDDEHEPERDHFFLLLSDDHDASIQMHRSEPILHYSYIQDSDDGSSEEEEESGTGSDEDSESGESKDEEDNHSPSYSPFKVLDQKRDESQSRGAMMTRSLSLNTGYYSDRPLIESRDRKRIHGRIQGIGNSQPAVPPPPRLDIVSPRTFREKIQALREVRMQKMEIGAGDSRVSWAEKLENAVVEILDAALPPPPTFFGALESSENQGVGKIGDKLSTESSKTGVTKLNNPPNDVTFLNKREEIGNDSAYIVYLECELRNKDFELASWKRRVKELELEIKRLRGVADDSSQESEAVGDREEEGESEIEWQTGVPREGILIDIGDSSDVSISKPGQYSNEETSEEALSGSVHACGTLKGAQPERSRSEVRGEEKFIDVTCSGITPVQPSASDEFKSSEAAAYSKGCNKVGGEAEEKPLIDAGGDWPIQTARTDDKGHVEPEEGVLIKVGYSFVAMTTASQFVHDEKGQAGVREGHLLSTSTHSEDFQWYSADDFVRKMPEASSESVGSAVESGVNGATLIEIMSTRDAENESRASSRDETEDEEEDDDNTSDEDFEAAEPAEGVLIDLPEASFSTDEFKKCKMDDSEEDSDAVSIAENRLVNEARREGGKASSSNMVDFHGRDPIPQVVTDDGESCSSDADDSGDSSSEVEEPGPAEGILIDMLVSSDDGGCQKELQSV